MAARSHSLVRPLLALAFAALMIPLHFPSAAAGHGVVAVGPSVLDLTDPPLFPEGTKIGILRFQQHFSEPTTVDVDVVPRTSDGSDASDWLTLDRSGRLQLPPGEHQFRVQVDVPPTASNGFYETTVRFRVHPAEEPSFEGSGATAYTAVTAIVKIAVQNDQQVKRAAVEAMDAVRPTEVDGGLAFGLRLKNTGNVDVNPHIRLHLSDQMQENVIATHWFNDTLIAPGVAERVDFTVGDHGLPMGQYWAQVTAVLDSEPLYQSGATSFEVLEKGALLRELRLATIQIDGNVTAVPLGTTIKLEPLVENLGQVPAVGQFVGEVRRDGELIGGIESRAIEIEVGATERLPILYEPTEPGHYEFVGRVHYGHKVTEEKSLLLRVEEGRAESNLVVLGAIGLLVCGIGFGAYRFAGRPD